MYYADLLKLCGWEEDQMVREKPRLLEAFRILGLGPEEMKIAEDRVREGYDIDLIGVRKALGVWIGGLVDVVLSRIEGKKVVYYSYPPLGGLGGRISAMGKGEILCVCPEFIIDIVLGAIFDTIDPIIETGEDRALPPGRALCALNKIRVGAITKGIIPVPDLLLASSFYCDQGGQTDEWLHEIYGAPWVVLDNIMDSPWDEFPTLAPKRVSYLAAELENGWIEAAEILGQKPDEKDWGVYADLYGRFVTGIAETNSAMKADPPPISQSNLQLVRFLRNATSYDRFADAVEAIDILIPELRQRVKNGTGPLPKGSPRVTSFLIPQRDHEVAHLIEKAGIAIPVTFLSYDAYTEMLDPTHTTVAEKSAQTDLSRGLYHSTSALVYWTKKAVEDFDLDGVLWSQPIHCRPMASSGFLLKKAIEEELGIPVLILEVDWYDNRIFSGESMRTKIETFGHLLAAKKSKGKINKEGK
jgi:benzoyl-CoA reductase/2-hydroxyglutaryl-CoA dehydratase subunit BcrC/BadD/HgdB